MKKNLSRFVSICSFERRYRSYFLRMESGFRNTAGVLELHTNDNFRRKHVVGHRVLNFWQVRKVFRNIPQFFFLILTNITQN